MHSIESLSAIVTLSWMDPVQISSFLLNLARSIVQHTLLRTILASGLVSLALLLVIYGWLKEQRYQELQKRLRQLEERSPEDELQDMGSFGDRIVKPFGRSMLAALGRMTPGSNLETLRQQLALAGHPGNLAAIDVLGLKMLCAIVLGVLSTLFFFKTRDMKLAQALLFGIVGSGIGLYLPNYWLRNKISQRRVELTKALPNALDMLTTMMDAGLGFDMALLRLGERWRNPLTEEFERTVNEMNMGVRRADALRSLAERNDSPELRSFTAVLVQADSLGISIADILHAQSEQMRMRRRQWAEEQANKMPIKMLPIIVLFIFPALFAVILGPAIPGVISALGGL